MNTEHTNLDEPIWEVKNIAQEIKRTERQTFRLLETGLLPAKKIGGRWVSTRRQLRAAIMGDAA